MQPIKAGPLSGGPKICNQGTGKTIDHQVQEKEKLVSSTKSTSTKPSEKSQKTGMLATMKKAVGHDSTSSKTKAGKTEQKQRNVPDLSLEEELKEALYAKNSRIRAEGMDKIHEMYKTNPKECVEQIKQFLKNNDKDGARINEIYKEAFDPMLAMNFRTINSFGSFASILLETGQKYPDWIYLSVISMSDKYGEEMEIKFKELNIEKTSTEIGIK